MWPPRGAELVLSFVVEGEPRPAGSKVSGVVMAGPKGAKQIARHADGRVKTFTKDSSGQSGKSWRGDIRDAFRGALQQGAIIPFKMPLDGPLALELTFYAERPKSHFGTGRNADVMKGTAPAFPHAGRLADGTKLCRAAEDALNKIAFVDDRRICACQWRREYGRPRVEIKLYTLPVLDDERPRDRTHEPLALAL